MPAFGIEIRGANRIANQLRRWAADNPRRVDRVVGEWAKRTRAVLKSTPYPAAPAGSRYRRTGRLASSWRAIQASIGTWQIVNRAAFRGRYYASYVVGNFEGGRQAWMHRGRWWKAKDVLDAELPSLRAAMEREMQQSLNEIG